MLEQEANGRAAGSNTVEISRGARHFVIHGRSKERSDAAQTRGSMPGLPSVAAVQDSSPLHSTADVAEWILGSPRRRFAPASPVDDEAEMLRPIAMALSHSASKTESEKPVSRLCSRPESAT
ncbi:hypothetical protein EN943_21025 [Mesorhizobium sp. M7A.F.Ca.US.006.01.1.1]|nr:hypothetical protein EN943_21025 [Mesorhizobium sp. M7A.F.Ca.US.006.01.1.1]